MNTDRQALIIGAGITGPVTAMALQRAGYEPTIFEAYDRTADGIGAFLTLAPNGLAALRALDIDGRDLGGFDTTSMVISSWTGKRLGEFPTAHEGVVSRTVTRSDIYTALRDEAVRRGVRIAYGRRLEDATPLPDGVLATFADGTEVAGDLLVGADGLGSRTRHVIDPDCPPPRYTGLLNTGGYAKGLDLDVEPGIFQMTFGKRAFFAYQVDPDGQVWWFANVPFRPRSDGATDEELARYTLGVWRRELERLFADDRTPALEVIAATERILPPWNTHDLPSVPTWHRDRMLLIGDAAHAVSPTSGQGASLAAEDGVVLARCLRDERDERDDQNTDRAFAAFEAERRPRVERMVKEGKQRGDDKVAGPVTRILRDNVIMPLVMKQLEKNDPQAWVHAYDLRW